MERKLIRKKFDIDKCIDLSNPLRLKVGEPRIRSLRHLSQIISKEKGLNEANFYIKLYRSQKEGFLTVNEMLLDWISIELKLSKNKILVKF